jgi:hypothetical protein
MLEVFVVLKVYEISKDAFAPQATSSASGVILMYELDGENHGMSSVLP